VVGQEDGAVELPTSSWYGPTVVTLPGARALADVLTISPLLKGLDLSFSQLSRDPTAVIHSPSHSHSH
jgi:hypothetical protein